ncbi:MAG: branched-chain amino acid ABC transporter substrate-binding protein [Alphaproteobacteria bacterium]|nr:MAG: branched-chain amino acid ABC transporter substrate-binding protein [Alphaproteobacteria bacterium]
MSCLGGLRAKFGSAWKTGVALAALVVVAGAPNATYAQGKKAELKVGFIAALSGPGMSWGMGMLGGLELAAEDVNKAGGVVVGDTTYTIKVIAYDDKYAGPPAAQAAQRLVSQDEVKVIFGPLGSVSMLAIADTTESNKVLVLSNSYTMKALSKDKPYTFRLTPTTAENSDPMVAFIAKDLPDAKTVAIISPNDESGKEVQSHSEPAYQKYGLKVISKEFYERGTQDFVPVLTRIMAQNPAILDLDGSTPVDSGVIMKQARQIGFKGKFVKVGGPGVADSIKIAGPAAEDLYYYSPWNPEEPKTKALTDRFEAKYKIPMNGLGIFFYEGAHMLFATMKQTKSVDTDVLRKALESQKEYMGLQGRYVWGGAKAYGINHQWIAPFFVGQVRKGAEVMRTKIEP